MLLTNCLSILIPKGFNLLFFLFPFQIFSSFAPVLCRPSWTSPSSLHWSLRPGWFHASQFPQGQCNFTSPHRVVEKEMSSFIGMRKTLDFKNSHGFPFLGWVKMWTRSSGAADLVPHLGFIQSWPKDLAHSTLPCYRGSHTVQWTGHPSLGGSGPASLSYHVVWSDNGSR